MGFLNRDHVSAVASQRTAHWDEPSGAFVYDKKIGADWTPVAITTPFGMDVYRARHGYEFWHELGGKRTRSTSLTPVSAPLPPTPEAKATCIYSVPIYSKELAGGFDLIIKGKTATEAFCDLFDQVAAELGGKPADCIPVITHAAQASDFGVAPLLSVNDWCARPKHWDPILVEFPR